VVTYINPSMADDDEEVEAFATWMRSGGGPGDVVVRDRSGDRRPEHPSSRARPHARHPSNG
jgi:hypothetical protein